MVYRRGPNIRRVRKRKPARKTYSKRRASSRRSYRRSMPACPTEMTPSAKFILAQLDPFEASVQGAKIPDSNTLPSISNTDVDLLTLQSSAVASDLCAFAFRPTYTWGSVTATPGAAVTWGAAYAGTNRSKRTQYIAAMELFRPVAHAVRLSCQLAPTTASGFVHIGLSTEAVTGVTWAYPTTVATMSNLQYYKRVTLASLTQSPLTCINKWMDDTAFRYSDPTQSVNQATQQNFHTDYAWATIVILVEGAPVSSNVLSVEHLLLSEGIPQRDGVIFGTPAAPNSPGALGAAGTAVAGTEPFHTEAEQESYIQQGINIAAQSAAAAGEAVFNNVAVPLIQRAAYSMTGTAAQMALNAIVGRGGIAGVNNNPNRLALN